MTSESRIPEPPRPGNRATSADQNLDHTLAEVLALPEDNLSTHIAVFERVHAALQQRLEADGT